MKTILKMMAYDIFLCIIMVQFAIKRPDIMYYHSVHIQIYVYHYNGWCMDRDRTICLQTSFECIIFCFIVMNIICLS